MNHKTSQQCCDDCDTDEPVAALCSIDFDTGTLYWETQYATTATVFNDGNAYPLVVTGAASETGSITTLNLDEDVVLAVEGPCGSASVTCANCDEVQCSSSISMTYNDGPGGSDTVHLNWSGWTDELNHQITSVTINGVEQLSPPALAGYSASGAIEYTRGDDVPDTITIVITNECGNTCTTVINTPCCLRTTHTYFEVTGFAASYSHTCTGVGLGGAISATASSSVEITGLDGLNGTVTGENSDTYATNSNPCFRSLGASTSAVIVTEVEDPAGFAYLVRVTYTGVAYISLNSSILFHVTQKQFYQDFSGSIIQSTLEVDEWHIIGGGPEYDGSSYCKTPGPWSGAHLITGISPIPNQCDIDGDFYSPPPVCAGQSSTGSYACQHIGGTKRAWLDNI